MKVILLEKMNNLGQQGDVVTVKDGYGRNFLIPKKKAVEANRANIGIIEQQRKLVKKQYSSEIEEMQAIAAKLAETQITIALKAGENDRLFGSVTSVDIANKLNVLGFTIDRKDIVHNESIKALGEYDIEIKLHKEVTGKIKLIVEKQQDTSD